MPDKVMEQQTPLRESHASLDQAKIPDQYKPKLLLASDKVVMKATQPSIEHRLGELRQDLNAMRPLPGKHDEKVELIKKINEYQTGKSLGDNLPPESYEMASTQDPKLRLQQDFHKYNFLMKLWQKFASHQADIDDPARNPQRREAVIKANEYRENLVQIKRLQNEQSLQENNFLMRLWGKFASSNASHDDGAQDSQRKEAVIKTNQYRENVQQIAKDLGIGNQE